MRFKLKGFGILVFMFVLGLVEVSCGSQVPVKRFYTLSNSQNSVVGIRTLAVCNKTLVVASIDAASGYSDDKIVFRVDEYEVRHFNYRIWVSPPEEMIKSLLARKIEKSRLFSSVESLVHAPIEYFALYGKIDAIEEIDGDNGWNARIAMSFTLKDSKNDNVVWAYEFDEQKPVEHKDITSVVSTLSKVYNEEVQKMMDSMSSFLSSSELCQETD